MIKAVQQFSTIISKICNFPNCLTFLSVGQQINLHYLSTVYEFNVFCVSGSEIGIEKWTTDENSCWTCTVCYSVTRIWQSLIQHFKANGHYFVYKMSLWSGVSDKSGKGRQALNVLGKWYFVIKTLIFLESGESKSDLRKISL